MTTIQTNYYLLDMMVREEVDVRKVEVLAAHSIVFLKNMKLLMTKELSLTLVIMHFGILKL